MGKGEPGKTVRTELSRLQPPASHFQSPRSITRLSLFCLYLIRCIPGKVTASKRNSNIKMSHQKVL